MTDLDLQAHQQEVEKRAFLDDWHQMQLRCPGFCERLKNNALDWEEAGLIKLYEARDENAIIHARAMVVAGRAMGQLFNIADNIEDELNRNTEEGMH